MHVHRLFCLLGIASLTACELAELSSPEPGNCDAETALNSWPQFEGNDGEPPQYGNVGFNEGQVPRDFKLTDQYGDPMCLWQMVGKWVVIDSSTLWCEPCKRIASTVKCQAESYGDDLVYMTLIVQDRDTNPADQTHAEAWADQYDLSTGTQTPVIADGDRIVASNLPGGTTSFPSLLLLNPDLEIAMSGVGESADGPVRARLDQELGVSSEDCAHE